ncbi:hypothetical protein K7432_000111 [Basidiobolus ranarum]|uniref:Aminotransferase class I/classII large domain-containing protein n=1 Tax=Basidiobolus ranarum TaxID=34480 RepID=A0ABR2X516_9FUNG
MTKTNTALNGTKEEGVWDAKLQQFHGGQDWKFIENFIEDFSVTTNPLGTPKQALQAARDSIDTCHHYPPANQEPAKTSLAEFIWPNDYLENRDRLLLGNGASELIDLVVRSAPKGTWKPGPWDVQYKEYERSAVTNGRTILGADEQTPATLSCVVNPCNPTGDYINVEAMKKWIMDNVEDNGVVVVDESMQPWHSANFREDSLTTQKEFVESIYSTRNISVYVIHSWTKLWSCTGLRTGSIVCPTAQHCNALKKIQVPWSVNTMALAFMNAVVKDTEYLEETWKITPVWRKYVIDELTQLSLKKSEDKQWEFFGKDFLSWVWVDMKDSETADLAVQTAKDAGVPVRSGRPGYYRDTFVRVAVRDPKFVDILIQAWKNL